MNTNMSLPEIASVNPATKKTVGSVSPTPLNQLPEIFLQAQKAKTYWAHLQGSKRAKILRCVRKKLVAHMDELSKLIASETGKTNWHGL